jgi:hypothetical protein
MGFKEFKKAYNGRIRLFYRAFTLATGFRDKGEIVA